MQGPSLQVVAVDPFAKSLTFCGSNEQFPKRLSPKIQPNSHEGWCSLKLRCLFRVRNKILGSACCGTKTGKKKPGLKCARHNLGFWSSNRCSKRSLD